MTGLSRGFAVLLLIAVLCAGAFCALRFSMATDITAFMPGGGDPFVTEVTKQMADSELSKTMVLMISAKDPARVEAASVAFEKELRSQPALKRGLVFLEGGPSSDSEQAIYELYHPRRLGFVAQTPEEARHMLNREGLQLAASKLKALLSQPMSPLLSRLATSDPLLTVMRFFEQLQKTEGRSLKVSNGRFVTRDGTWAVLFAATKERAFNSKAQAPIVAAIERAFANTNSAFDHSLTLEQSAIQRVAVLTEKAIKRDIQRVSTLSIISVVVVLLSLFCSLRLAALAAIPIATGVLAGMSVCLLVYGRIHGITLAFGASLIGVAIDYVVHLYCHHAVAPSAVGPRATYAAIAPSLMTGAITTLAGFIALAFAGFPGLQEVSLFASAGIVAALLATSSWLPSLLPNTMTEVPLRDTVVDALNSWLEALRQQRAALWILLVAASVFVATQLPHLTLKNDLLHMARVDAGLAAEDARVRERVARFDQTRFVVAFGKSDEQALQANDNLADALHKAVDSGELAGFRNVATLLPSKKRQLEVARAVRSQLGNGEPLINAFEAEGFRGAALAPFLNELQKAELPLTYADLVDSPLSTAVRTFHLALNDQSAFVTFVRGVHDMEALHKRLGSIAGVTLIDQGQQLRSLYQAYQTKTAQLIALGLIAVLLILIARYRHPRKVIAAFAPALLAAAVTVSTLQLLGHSLDLISLTALLMVVSMGVDYGVFLVDAESLGPRHARAALLSVMVAALSTVLGFGLLALSDHPMLATIGITAWVGILSCLVLAPTALVLASTKKP